MQAQTDHPGEVDPRGQNLIWIDLEMTGLNPDQDHIIEIATVVTDSQLNVISEGPVLAIHQPASVLDGMDEWNRTTHAGSGLTERVRKSTLTAAAAEKMTLDFLRLHSLPGASPMCGNSVCQDRRFLAREMPALEKYFHYRNLDVSTVKELARRWAPSMAAGVKKKSAHLAIEDVRESIGELQYYRTYFIVGSK
jgi:oligoribonuclease